jgi:5S rRNA maturation endonuclease (ribonuclease M5)
MKRSKNGYVSGVRQEIEKHVKKIIRDDTLVIVEGKKDKAALKKLGIKNILALNSKPLYKIIDKVDEKEVIILTDLDKTGKRLYSKLQHQLSQKGVKINNNFRNFLFRKTKLRQIEGIDSYLDSF